MNKWIAATLIILLVASCRSKKKEAQKDTSAYFPVRSFLQSQVKELDTSLYRFIRIETVNGRSDTTDISREEIRKYAADFLSIPDLRDPEYGSDYDQFVSYDSLVGRVFMSYTAYDKDVEVVKQDVTIVPGFGTTDDVVQTVFLTHLRLIYTVLSGAEQIVVRIQWIQRTVLAHGPFSLGPFKLCVYVRALPRI